MLSSIPVSHAVLHPLPSPLFPSLHAILLPGILLPGTLTKEGVAASSCLSTHMHTHARIWHAV